MPHWAAQYLGLPWIAGERDCWAFFREVQREQFGRDIPAVDVDVYSAVSVMRTLQNAPERTLWTHVMVPRQGDGVLMAQNNRPSHVGVWLEVDGGAVLHCAEGFGVLCQSVPSLRAAGWSGISYWRRQC